MALLRIPKEDLVLSEREEIQNRLKTIGIDYGIWKTDHELSENPSNEEILEAYAPDIERAKEEGGYMTADVIAVQSDTPGLDAMLAKFSSEHWHDEDEVRFIIDGTGVFHFNPGDDQPVTALEVTAGDYIRVPRGTLHWFDLCQDRTIKAIRLFQDPSGWTPRYSESGKEASFLEVCLGPTFISSN
ncbi:MAG: cupin domain-containing protein [Verrucomicrobia bacterium]|nr:cupin domain-containing protein [Verrucomicrobiota bacterium]MDA1067101.1 cupin domain-containing protein [Verrucomicrobiota bacterium]